MLNWFQSKTPQEKLYKSVKSAILSKNHKPIFEEVKKSMMRNEGHLLIPNDNLEMLGAIGVYLKEHTPPPISIAEYGFFVGISEGNIDLAEMTRASGVPAFARGNFGLLLAAHNSELKSIEYLKNNGVKGKGGNAVAALSTALEYGDVPVAQALIGMGISVSQAAISIRSGVNITEILEDLELKQPEVLADYDNYGSKAF